MIIKTFRAETSASALKRVKLEMGGDAIVLKTSQTTGAGNRMIFEVTACLENPTVSQSSVILDSIPEISENHRSEKVVEKNNLVENIKDEQVGNLDQIDKRIEELLNKKLLEKASSPFGIFQSIYETLDDADFEKGFLADFVRSLADSYDHKTNITNYTHDCLSELFDSIKADPVEFKYGDKVIFMGPAGSGKSSVLGKIAASLVIQKNKKVKLSTIDDFKMGAYDEISAYGEILGVDVTDLGQDEDVNYSNDITLIDAPSLPNDPEKIKALKEKIEKINPEYRFVTISALIRSRDVIKHAALLKQFRPTHLVITKTDLTESYGSIMAASRALGCNILFLSNTPGGIGQLEIMNTEIIVKKILSSGVDSE